MKVLLIVNGTQALYSHRLELIQALLDKGNEVCLASPQGKELASLISMGCKHYDTPLETRGKNPFSDIHLLCHYIQILRQCTPDCVLSFYTKSNIWSGIACQICNVPYITNITGLGTAVESHGFIHLICSYLYKFAIRKAHCVFFQNEANLKYFISRGLNPSLTRRINGSGVSLERFPLQEYPSDTESVEFLFVSRIIKEKGIDEYIEAARAIKSKHPNTIFHVVGNFDGGYHRDLKALQRENVIIYHGQQFDIHPFIRRTHCTILPSYYPEGMSNVLLESAASGRPIITTNRPGCGETVEDGVTGMIVEPKNVTDLTEKIETFLSMSNDQRKQMGLNGRKKMEQEFDRKLVINAYLLELEDVKKVRN